MNGGSSRKASNGPSQHSRYGSASQVQPSTAVLVDGYRKSLDTVSGVSSYRNSLKPRPGQWNVDDPVSMHLLMETAMGDSQHYEVLSPEDIDKVKRDLAMISNRIEATKRKLVLETKVRDATQSINRLYAARGRDGSVDRSTETSGHRSVGSKSSGNDIPSRTDSESQESARKCDELAKELWNLEKQEQDLHRLLMEHTAGVLQMTHKGYLKKEPTIEVNADGDRAPNGASTGHVGIEFGDQSLYRPYSQIDDASLGHDHPLPEDTRGDFTQQNDMVIEVEAKVEELNARLRDMILEMKPRKEDLPNPPPELADHPENLDQILWKQLDFLEQCLDVVHDLYTSGPDDLKIDNLDAEEKLETINSRLFDVMTQTAREDNTNYMPPPEATGQTLQDQLDYLEGGLQALERRVTSFADDAETSSAKLASYQERAEKYVSVIGELWDILIASEHEAKMQANEAGVHHDLSTDRFSLQGFSTKVKELQARATELSEHKAVLTRQVQQQRELNETADTARDARMTAMRSEIEDANKLLDTRSKEAKSHREEIAKLVAELEAIRLATSSQEQQKQLEDSEALSTEKEARRQTEEIAEQKIQRLMAQLEEARETTAAMELNALTLKSDLEEKSQSAEALQTSMRGLESEVVRLQTELTFARAELDGAYGTRAQRAAETAGDPALQKELDLLRTQNSALTTEIATLKTNHVSSGKGEIAGLQAHIDTLQQELSETIADYEAMTKASIEYEKEREQLENLIDTLRDRIESLDGQLSEDRVQMLGTKSPGGSREAGAGGNTSTMVLKNEFKKMMRETRAEHAKALRAEQEERRRLEGILRTLRKDSVPSKSIFNANLFQRQNAASSDGVVAVTPAKSLRRKPSTKALYPQIDSSESLPSSHSSIFEALYCSPSSEYFAGRESRQNAFVTGGSRSDGSSSKRDHTLEEPNTLETLPVQSIHHPTPLETITEQKSIATLRPQLSFSIRRKPSLPSLYVKQRSTLVSGETISARRKLSFSLDDLTVVRRQSRLFKNSSSTSSVAFSSSQPNTRYPTIPKEDPPPRIPTPPGLPTFNTPAAAAYRLRSPNSTSFRDIFRFHRTPEEVRWLAQTRALPHGTVMRGEDGTLIRGRWRPSQSGHTGNERDGGRRGILWNQLHGIPNVTVPHNTFPQGPQGVPISAARPAADEQMRQILTHHGERVRVLDAIVQTTAETLAARDVGVDSYNVPFDRGNVTSPTTRPHLLPGTPEDQHGGRGVPPNDAKLSRWVRFGEAFCTICCGAEKSEDGLLHPRIIPNTMDGMR